jgi:hypothetical protein
LNKSEQNHFGLLDREKKEIVLTVWLLDSHTPPNRLLRQSWKDVCREFGVPGIHSGKELRRLHYPLVFESMFRMRQALFVRGGFVHTEFDFLDAFSKEYLIVCGRTCVNFALVNDILGIVEWTGTHDASHIAQLARSTIDRICPDSVVLASNTVDGALQAASEKNAG